MKKPTLTDEERAAWRKLHDALKPFRDLNSSMPLSYVTAMALVAMEEGKGVAEYADDAKIAATVMTRNLLDIGERNRQREEGYGLIVKERDLFDFRKQRARITPKGKALSRHLVAALAKD